MAEGGKARIALFGAGGRMGRAIAEAAAARDDVEIGADAPDVFVDFTAPEAVEANLRAAIEAGRPILIGTTGLADEHRRRIDEAAREVAIIEAANTSLGVNLLSHLVREAAARLGPDWDVEILEMHHRHKKDSPSGTALLLGSAAAQGRGADAEALFRTRREREREAETIGFASLRGGSVAGDHMVLFAGDGERLELAHRAEGRAIFAKGAIEGALWLIGKPPGRYSMADVLGLK